MSAAVDALVIGAGAAGLFCAAQAGQRGLKVLLVDHAPKLAEKIRISGGGRCNFTNREAGPANYLSENPHFCRSALARYPASEFIALVQRHGIAFHEKHKGQLFCDHSAQDIIELLLHECAAGGVERWQPCAVHEVQPTEAGWTARTDRGEVLARRVVIATGGLPVPKIGASDWGLRLAERLGHRLVAPREALVPLTFDTAHWAPFVPLAGIARPVAISTAVPGKGKRSNTVSFLEDLLFTHRGLSGPAVLQISSFWRPGQTIEIDLLPGTDLFETLQQLKRQSRRQLGNELAALLTQRLADTWLALQGIAADTPMPQVPDATLRRLADSLQHWTLTPSGTEGWAKAEVMAGGVDTRDLSSQTMESRLHPGLYFIGEVVDVTGWLGGYNFQWAWASAVACAEAMAAAA
ncbi:NAD(P)/FAD-dependent oxidoreductase [Ideonella sp. 4Y11]|uniref:NAD(P)/FAD-dependent oxidoreductase n=1 Tax=Ideonella aquatica TaxID=2824119 RepID=A0A940YMT9_9BURK|nr:NAD(P)/FAD-dependent oxidoreductase [Ideonella aquatica]MBQ0960784.1 NAD(P)/FAD-dependent oxidoreductase [Ideonella aquatica]